MSRADDPPTAWLERAWSHDAASIVLRSRYSVAGPRRTAAACVHYQNVLPISLVLRTYPVASCTGLRLKRDRPSRAKRQTLWLSILYESYNHAAYRRCRTVYTGSTAQRQYRSCTTTRPPCGATPTVRTDRRRKGQRPTELAATGWDMGNRATAPPLTPLTGCGTTLDRTRA